MRPSPNPTQPPPPPHVHEPRSQEYRPNGASVKQVSQGLTLTTMHATDPVESKPRKLGYDSVHMEGRDKRTLAEAPGQSPSKNPDALL